MLFILLQDLLIISSFGIQGEDERRNQMKKKIEKMKKKNRNASNQLTDLSFLFLNFLSNQIKINETYNQLKFRLIRNCFIDRMRDEKKAKEKKTKRINWEQY